LRLKEKELESVRKELEEKDKTIGQLEQMALKLKDIIEQQEQQLAEQA
jgi:hypothetical protein